MKIKRLIPNGQPNHITGKAYDLTDALKKHFEYFDNKVPVIYPTIFTELGVPQCTEMCDIVGFVTSFDDTEFEFEAIRPDLIEKMNSPRIMTKFATNLVNDIHHISSLYLIETDFE